MNDICTTALKCIFDFQTLASGTLAIAAAIIGAIAILWAAQLPFRVQNKRDIEQTNRRQQLLGSILLADFQTISRRARQAEGTIRVTIAANANVNDETRRKMTLVLPEILNDWEIMSSVPSTLLQELAALRQKIADHNFDMEQAGGAFGADNFRQSILSRINQIRSDANVLAGHFAAMGHLAGRQTSTTQKRSWRMSLNKMVSKIGWPKRPS
jgi:hypothetical protein